MRITEATQTDTTERLETPRHVATALGFTTARPIYRLIREGKLPAMRIGKRLLIDQADVEAMLALARTTSHAGGLRALEHNTRGNR